MIIIDN